MQTKHPRIYLESAKCPFRYGFSFKARPLVAEYYDTI
jgi:hypothetical protein